jgi:modulator of FtsH protease HflC
MRHLSAIVIAVIALLLIASLSVFTVDQRQQAIVFRLGEIIDVKTEPGIYFKIPLLDNVRRFDVRIQTLDTPESERFITAEKKNVLVDYFVKWRVIDPKQYYISVGGDAQRAETRLAQSMNDGLRAEFGRRTVHEVVSGERDQIMEIQRQRADADARAIGAQVVDLRLKRVDLTQEVSEAVYRRMEAERKRVANELRALGAAEGEKIRADADRQREVILAEAYKEAQTVRGEGDAKSSVIYADAFQQNPEFYQFYRSMEAYRQSFKTKSDVLVLEPTSEFFKYLNDPGDHKNTGKSPGKIPGSQKNAAGKTPGTQKSTDNQKSTEKPAS